MDDRSTQHQVECKYSVTIGTPVLYSNFKDKVNVIV